jgi:FkbM family methyltransferase
VYSFEPCERSFQLLKENVSINNLYWVEVYRLALSDKIGKAILHLDPINDGGHSLLDLSNDPDLQGWDTKELIEVVETTTLDNFIKEKGIRNIDFIKLDVEGAETLVLEGAKNTLSSGKVSKIICETGTEAQKLMGKTEKDLRNMFYSYNFRSYFISETLTEFGPETSVERLPNILYTREAL